MIARIVPYMNSFFELSHVSVEGNRIDPEFLESFGAYERAYDPETYKTAIQTNTSNLLLVDNVETIVEPEGAFITPRSPQDFEITNDELIIPTTRPIDRFVQLIPKLNVTYRVQ